MAQNINSDANDFTFHGKHILSVNEACRYMDISKSYLYKLTHTRTVPFSCPAGKKIYFQKADLDTWMLQNRRLSRAEIKAQASQYVKMHNR